MSNWNPSFEQKRTAAQDTWNLYKGAGSGNWMGGANDPYQIRGVQRAGDPNWVDFEYRPSSGGPASYYGSLSSGLWDNPSAPNDWLQGEVGNFYNAAGQGMQNAWGQGYGWSNAQGPTTPDINPVTPPQGIQPDQGGAQQPGGGTRVPGPGVGTPTTPDAATNAGLGSAQNILEQWMNMPQYYPGWWGNDYQQIDANKWQNAYPSFLDVPEYNGINLPGQYQGLMEGDYDRLEQALRTPGETAAQNAFEQGGDYLKNVMGGRGMYGSSVMGNQANTGLNDRYMDTMANNAAQAVAQRYGLQQGDQQFGANYGLQRAGLDRQNQLDQYKAAMTGRNLLNDYNNQRFQFDYGLGEAARGEYNNLLQNRFQYDLNSQAWRNALNENLFNAGLQLAGRGGDLQNSNRRYDLLQQQYSDQQNSDRWGMGFDLFDRMGGWDKIGNGLSDAWDKWGW